MMVGENPGQNQAATTTMAVLEQGLKVYTGIYRRVHRAMTKEFKKLYIINGATLDEEKYVYFLDTTTPLRVGRDDFNDDPNDVNIAPSADPNVVSDAQKLIKAQSLMEKLAAGLPLNLSVVTKKVLEAEGHEDIDDLMQVPPPQPNPEFMLEQAKFQHEAEMDIAEKQLKAFEVEAKALTARATAALNYAKADAEVAGIDMNEINTWAEILNKQSQEFREKLKLAKEMSQPQEENSTNAGDQRGAAPTGGKPAQ
jgi:chaperonin GroES